MSSTLDKHIDDLFALESMGLATKEKISKLLPVLEEITSFHYAGCNEYKRIIDAIYGGASHFKELKDLPYLPVRLFKELDLVSVDSGDIVKKMHSSGTSGMDASRIYLDRRTIGIQTKILSRIVSSKLGQKRLPMIVLDTESTISSRTLFSARAAGILGFSTFSNSRFFALDDDMNLRTDELMQFIEANRSKKFLIFGFTFMVWQHFVQALIKSEIKLDLSGSTLIHGGGWKKISEEYRVTNADFKSQIKALTKIENVMDYYGMVEQTGSLYFECTDGNLHSSTYSEVLFRDLQTLEPIGKGETGLIQVCSIVALSYPGHSLLTEDVGIYLGDDDCTCGSLGRYFQIVGRVAKAEIRGCSDTYKDGLTQ